MISASLDLDAPSTSSKSDLRSTSLLSPTKDSHSLRASAFEPRSVSMASITTECALVVLNISLPAISEAITPKAAVTLLRARPISLKIFVPTPAFCMASRTSSSVLP